MIYKIGNRKEDLNGKRIRKIATGEKGDVYKYKGEAIKLFNPDEQPPMTEDVAEYLTKIQTSRILLPRKLVFYQDAFRGYTLRLVQKKGNSRKLIALPGENLVENVETIESDIRTLSDKKVLLNGITPDNVLFNGRLYLTDPAHYKLLELYGTEDLERLNRYQFHVLFTELITAELKKCNYSPAVASYFRDLLRMKDVDQLTSDYLKEIIDPEDSIKQIVKKF